MIRKDVSPSMENVMNGALRLAIVLAAATLAWNVYGFAGNFFEHYWGGKGDPVVLVSYLANALLLTAIASISLAPSVAARALVLAGSVMALWSLGGVAVELGTDIGVLTRGTGTPPLNLPQPPALIGPLVPMITGAVTAAFAWRALHRPLSEARAS